MVEESDEYRTNPSRIYQLWDDIEALKTKEECMRKQRSKNSWLKEGDRNTKFFHYKANQRNKRNYILGLSNEAGVWVKEEDQLGKLVENYFEEMFTTLNPSGFDVILNGIQPTVLAEMNKALTCEFKAEEV